MKFFWQLPITALLFCVGCGGASSVLVQTSKVPAPADVPLWSDDFNATVQSAPNPANWTFDTGDNGFGNQELETYCAYGSSDLPCDPAKPNSFVGTDGYLHIVARKDAKGGLHLGSAQDARTAQLPAWPH